MADLVVGLAKTMVEGTVTMARSAMEEEATLQKSVQRDLLVISDEFEMMHSFLNDAKDRVTDNVTRTFVRQVRNMALDMEDCIDSVVHLDKKPHWWRRMMLPWCMPAAAPGKDLDASVANIEKLKARVEAMGHRNLRYNRIGDSGHKPVEQTNEQAVANPMEPNIFATETDAAKKQSGRVDLVMLINKKSINFAPNTSSISTWPCSFLFFGSTLAEDDDDDGEAAAADETEEAADEEKEGVLVGNEVKVEKDVDDVHQLKVISVLGKGSDLEMMSIKKAYDDPETRESFKCRAWVKLVHPFNPIEFIRSLLAQFYKNYCPEQEDPVDAMEVMMMTDNMLIEKFRRQISQKYLVVLEDMSSMVSWEATRAYLPDKKNGSCILVHTRQIGIACTCVGHLYRVRVSVLHKLPADHSVYVLFKVHSSPESWMQPQKWRIDGTPSSCKFGWVNVSRPFDLRDFSRSLHSELNPASKDQIMSTMNDPIEECREYLGRQENSSYFIVIDGLRCTEEWELIRPTFDSRKVDGVVIIITNEESVAHHCAAEYKVWKVWNVKGLEVSQAIKLFDKVVTNNWYWKYTKRRGEMSHRSAQTRDILLQKCGGLPKVICAVAESWEIVADMKVEDNLVSKLEATRRLEDVFSWLLKYFHSCPDSLKPCIVYLSIFPVNHTIRRRRLVRRWIAEGYFRDKKHSTAEEDGDTSFTKLVSLGMIQAARESVNDKRMTLCHVNGFLREYIVSQLMEDNFLFALEGNCKNLDIGSIVLHLAIDRSWVRDRNVLENNDFSRLRSLTVFGRWESFFISDKMGRLRVLDLEDVSSGLTNGDVENMVKLLPRLKFLSLRGCGEITHLSDSLGHLKLLQTLDIRETSVIKLPKSIIKLQKLQYIRAGRAVILDNDTAGTFGSLPVAAAANPSTSATPMRRPRAALGCLSKLGIYRRLDDDGSHKGVKVPRGIGKIANLHTLGVVDIGAAGEEVILEVKNLTLLHKLQVSGINRNNSEKFFSAISNLAHLESLSLQFQLQQDHEAAVCTGGTLSRLMKLRSLKLYGLVDRLPACIMQMWFQLHELEKFNLQMKMLPQQELDSIISLRSLRSLHLWLEEFQNGELCFGWSAQSFGGWINILEIACNSRLQAVRFGSRIEVEILKIRCCTVSSSLHFSGLRHMEELKEVWLTGSYEEAFKNNLEELWGNENKPIILEPEKPSSST
ncbi:hypothetical protein BAE44_0026271 [Dichanthelium oligosanthes]|uniref:Disease resistance protein RPM1 n=1 Tax=Dichanthelium oligosanthes TaxID=888268 RepID=A0A1E5UIK6_9POAL|nr:hypothetical protein BAE44_0026271 [Dichanthelium oligosanthes]